MGQGDQRHGTRRHEHLGVGDGVVGRRQRVKRRTQVDRERSRRVDVVGEKRKALGLAGVVTGEVDAVAQPDEQALTPGADAGGGGLRHGRDSVEVKKPRRPATRGRT